LAVDREVRGGGGGGGGGGGKTSDNKKMGREEQKIKPDFRITARIKGGGKVDLAGARKGFEFVPMTGKIC